MTVPLLPDTERRTHYAPSSSDGPFDVGFALYGDGTDYQNWLEVWLDGEKLTPLTDWTLDLTSGTLSSAARPITNARITLTEAVTGELDIVGARRPRRTTQFTEGVGVTAADHNRSLTDIVAVEREAWDRLSRSISAPPGETLTALQPAETRAMRVFAFDDDGNPTTMDTNAQIPIVMLTDQVPRGNNGAVEMVDQTRLFEDPTGIDLNGVSGASASVFKYDVTDTVGKRWAFLNVVRSGGAANARLVDHRLTINADADFADMFVNTLTFKSDQPLTPTVRAATPWMLTNSYTVEGLEAETTGVPVVVRNIIISKPGSTLPLTGHNPIAKNWETNSAGGEGGIADGIPASEINPWCGRVQIWEADVARTGAWTDDDDEAGDQGEGMRYGARGGGETLALQSAERRNSANSGFNSRAWSGIAVGGVGSAADPLILPDEDRFSQVDDLYFTERPQFIYFDKEASIAIDRTKGAKLYQIDTWDASAREITLKTADFNTDPDNPNVNVVAGPLPMDAAGKRISIVGAGDSGSVRSFINIKEGVMSTLVGAAIWDRSGNGSVIPDEPFLGSSVALWDLDANWTIAAGVLASNGNGDATFVADPPLTEGRDYLIEAVVANRTVGTAQILCGGTAGASRSADGTYSETLTAGASKSIIVRSASSFDGDITHLKVQSLYPTYGLGWALLSNARFNKPVIDLKYAEITQNANSVRQFIQLPRWPFRATGTYDIHRPTDRTAYIGIGSERTSGVVSGLKLYGFNSNGARADFASIDATVVDGTATSEDGQLSLNVAIAGTLKEVARISDKEILFFGKNTSATDYHRLGFKAATTTLSAVSGASVTATNLIPDGAFIVGMTTKVTTALGTTNGTTGYTVGDGTTADLWGAITGTAAGTTSDNRDFTAAGAFKGVVALGNVVITATGGNFDGTGAIEIYVHYFRALAD